jgi:hypothetical protein
LIPLKTVATALGLEGFSDDPGERAIEFMSNLPAVHTDGKIGLFGWQEKIIRDVYGTLRDDGLRQYQTVYAGSTCPVD